MSRVAIIGSGFSGLSAGCFLAAAGFDVTIIEKNETPGGRARSFAEDGFTFDMGPSWYWMPDVFEKFFAHFNKKPSDYYDLVRLDPSYRMIFNINDKQDMPAGIAKIKETFERLESGSGEHLVRFLEEAKFKYELSFGNLVYLPGLRVTELLDAQLIKSLFRVHVFKSISSYIKTFFQDPRLIHLLEFPVLFLGARPESTPALYSLMNYAEMALGTWYPIGGINRIVNVITSLASSLGVKFSFNSCVDKIKIESGRTIGLSVNGTFCPFDYIIASADYHHVEQDLLQSAQRNYSKSYWNKKVMAPSSLIFYIGINKKVDGLLHHTLFFDEDFDKHAKEIYDHPQWPSAPQFYVSCPSKTDPGVAPAGCENLMVLIPVAAGLDDTEEIRERYFDMVMTRMEKLIGQDIRPHVIFKKSYAHHDFIADYNAFKGNAYGMANTLLQTANLRPSIVNKKVKNLFYTGQLTIPGPGVPPALISGQVVATQLIKTHVGFVNYAV
ncbi:MAG TPA: phytoene desaturase family protein [Chryseolinea sp.]|nr:phytoene desaturase family protein [Chryseolinea sp.]